MVHDKASTYHGKYLTLSPQKLIASIERSMRHTLLFGNPLRALSTKEYDESCVLLQDKKLGQGKKDRDWAIRRRISKSDS